MNVGPVPVALGAPPTNSVQWYARFAWSTGPGSVAAAWSVTTGDAPLFAVGSPTIATVGATLETMTCSAGTAGLAAPSLSTAETWIANAPESTPAGLLA